MAFSWCRKNPIKLVSLICASACLAAQTSGCLGQRRAWWSRLTRHGVMRRPITRRTARAGNVSVYFQWNFDWHLLHWFSHEINYNGCICRWSAHSQHNWGGRFNREGVSYPVIARRHGFVCWLLLRAEFFGRKHKYALVFHVHFISTLIWYLYLKSSQVKL